MTSSRGYIAFEMRYIGSSIDSVAMTALKTFTVAGENGASVTIEAGEKFHAVRASSLGQDKWYIVRNVTGMKRCTCVSHKPCVHENHITTGRTLADLKAEVSARAAKRKASKKTIAWSDTGETVTPESYDRDIAAALEDKPVATRRSLMERAQQQSALSAGSRLADTIQAAPEPESPEPEPEFDAERHFWNPNEQAWCFKRMPTEPVAFLADRPAPVAKCEGCHHDEKACICGAPWEYERPVVTAPKFTKVDLSKVGTLGNQNRAFSLMR